jgi:anti-sigma B factor antagonist
MAELNEPDTERLRSATASVAEIPGGDGEIVLEVRGDIDVSSVDALRTAVERAISLAPRNLVFDMTGLRFMDSSGIAVLLQAAEQVGAVELRNPSAIIRRVITLSGLAEVLRMTP